MKVIIIGLFFVLAKSIVGWVALLGSFPLRDSSGTQLRSCIPGTFVTASKPRCWMGIPTLHAASITIYYMVPLSPTESGRETGAEMEVLVSFLEHKFVFRVSIIY